MEVIEILEAAMARPEEFRASLIRQADMHDDEVIRLAFRNERAAQGARASRAACLKAYDWIGRYDLSVGERARCVAAETGPLAVALNVAAKMLSISSAQRSAALVRWDEAHN